MNEFEVINLNIEVPLLLTLVGVLSHQNDVEVYWLDLLLELKNMDINVRNGEPITVPFTAKNIVDILTFLSKKEASIYDDLFKNFILIIENNEQKNEFVDFKIADLFRLKNESLNQHYQNGINTLRLSVDDEILS